MQSVPRSCSIACRVDNPRAKRTAVQEDTFSRSLVWRRSRSVGGAVLNGWNAMAGCGAWQATADSPEAALPQTLPGAYTDNNIMGAACNCCSSTSSADVDWYSLGV